jgi:putative hemolysin
MPPILSETLVIIVLVLINGVFAMSEMAMVTARRVRLQQRAEAGDRGARTALQLAQEPTAFLSTVQVGITLIGVLAGAFGGASIAEQLADAIRPSPTFGRYADALGLSAVVVAITYLSLVIGELVPKRMALGAPERIASVVARPMQLLSRAASPLVHLLSASTNLILRLAGVKPPTDGGVTEEEIRAMVEEAEQSGAVRPEEADVVEGAFRLGDRQAAMLMTPRRELEWLDVTVPAEEIRRQLVDGPAEHLLVCRGEIDDVLGFLRAEDLLAYVLGGGGLDTASVQRLTRKPLFVPAVMPAYRLLKQLQLEAQQAAVVLDEYGGLVGVVTVDDILQDLVGELGAIAPGTEPSVVRREDGSWLIDAQLPIADVERLVATELVKVNDVGFHTLGGYVMSVLGHLPAVGEHFVRHGVRFEVLDMDGRRIDKVLVTRLPS